MAQTRFGIIGYGDRGKARRKTLEQRADTEIIATYDAKHPGDDFPHTSDWNVLLDRDDLDAVMISVENALAPQIIIKALDKGLHVFAEAGPGRTLEDVIHIRAAEHKAAGKVLKFGFDMRHHYSVLEAQKIAASGALGDLISMRGTYGTAQPSDKDLGFDVTGGGILLDQGIHMVDLMHAFAGPFEEVKSLTDARVWRERGVEDNVMALLRTNAGMMAMLHSTATSWRETFRLELGFEEGYLWLEGKMSDTAAFGPEALVIGRLERDAAGRPIANPKETVRKFTVNHSWELELAEFMAAIHGEKRLQAGTSQQAFDAMNAVQRIYAADHSFTHESLSS